MSALAQQYEKVGDSETGDRTVQNMGYAIAAKAALEFIQEHSGK